MIREVTKYASSPEHNPAQAKRLLRLGRRIRVNINEAIATGTPIRNRADRRRLVNNRRHRIARSLRFKARHSR